MEISSKDAQKFIRDFAGSRLRSKATFLLLGRMAAATYRGKQAPDISKVLLNTSTTTLMKWGMCSERQLRTIIKDLSAKGIVRVTARNSGRLHYHLDLTPLRDGEKSTDAVRRTAKEKRADRASKARAQRARNRQEHRLTDAVQVMRENRDQFFSLVLRPHSVRKRDENNFPEPTSKTDVAST